MSKEEKIIELRKEVEKFKELLGMMKGDFSSGSYGQWGLPSTKSYLNIVFEYKSDFYASILSYSFSEKMTAEIAIPVITEKLKKREKELFKLEHSFWDRVLKY